MSEEEIEHASQQWATTFSDLDGPLEQSQSYQGLLGLWNVARDVVERQKALILLIAGSPEFFRYLQEG